MLFFYVNAKNNFANAQNNIDRLTQPCYNDLRNITRVQVT